MEAGLTCFAKLGYGSTAVEDIVAEAGMARGTFYLHFNKKLDLVRALTEDLRPAVGELSERLDQVLANKAADKKAIRAWITEAFAWFHSHHTIVAVWYELGATEPSFEQVSPFFTIDHMPLYLSQRPRRRREAARIRVMLLVQQLAAAFHIAHVTRQLDVRDELLIDVLTDLWVSALTNVDASAGGAGRPVNS